MNDGHESEISVTKHLMKRNLHVVGPVNCPSYKAKHNAKELENANTDRKLDMKVIPPTQAEWAVFTLKKNRLLISCDNY